MFDIDGFVAACRAAQGEPHGALLGAATIQAVTNPLSFDPVGGGT